MTELRDRAVLGTPPEGDASRTRRRFRRRQWSRRWLAVRPLLVIVALLLMVGTGAWVVWFSPALTTAQVRVSGTASLPEPLVRRAAQVPLGTPLARIDLAAIDARVERIAEVESAEVTRAWPHAVEIAVVERRPVATVQRGDRWWLLDDEGRLFGERARRPVALAEVRPARGRTPVDREAVREVARVVSSLPGDLAARVSFVTVATVDQITLTLRDGRRVVWGSADDSALKAEVLVALLGSREARRIDGQPASSYDVSVPSQPTVRR